MSIKTFQAHTLENALSAARSELGPDPKVVSIRATDSLPNVFGSTTGVEVLANSVPWIESVPALAFPESSIEAISRMETLNTSHERVAEILGSKRPTALRSVKACSLAMPEDLLKITELLINNSVQDSLCYDIIAEVSDLLDQNDALSALDLASREIKGRVSISNPFVDLGRKQIFFALVGPTGVGKTTALAKLAANEVLARGHSAAMLTLDKFHIGAVERLKVYSKIIGIPFSVAVGKEDMKTKLSFYSEKDVVFIDTAGIGVKDRTAIQMLSLLLGSFPNVGVHLMLPATAGLKDLSTAMENFQIFAPKSCIASKVDEGESLGGLFSISCRSKLPFSYFSTGQNVPEDIEPASRERFADHLLGITAQ